MALKRKLTESIERMGLIETAPAVHVHIPASDPAADVVRASEAFINTVTNLKDERDELRTKNEELNRKCVFLMKTNTRVENERDWWRKQALEYARKGGELVATIGGMRSLADNAYNTAVAVQNLCDAMSQPETGMTAPTQHVDAAFDLNGLPQGDSPPAINIEELHLSNGITGPTRPAKMIE